MKVDGERQDGNNNNDNNNNNSTYTSLSSGDQHGGEDRSEDRNGAGHVGVAKATRQGAVVPRNRSTGNLLSEVQETAARGRVRYSVGGAATKEIDVTRIQPFEHDHSLGISGLRRIRRQPQSREPTLPSSPEESFLSPQLPSVSNMPISTASSKSAPLQKPSTAGSLCLEDLQRFPSESLHSFSFAQQCADGIHGRQSILKKSIEFMRDRLNWGRSNPALASAQARASGDAELQSMVELLKKANVLGQVSGNEQADTYLNGPLTGPAHVDGPNLFERSFTSRSTSIPETAVVDDDISAKDQDTFLASNSEDPKGLSAYDSALSPQRTDLKRTFTDVSLLSLQTRLMEALAQPYSTDEHSSAPGFFPPGSPTVLTRTAHVAQTVAGPALHSHSSKWAPSAQAVFRTDAKAPWTILAANDLACLIFGVTRAEVRRLGILEVVQESRRKWLEEKLQGPGTDRDETTRTTANGTARKSLVGGRQGITAQLLSKAPARVNVQRRSQTDDGSGGYYKAKAAKNHPTTKSRGVLLCGDVVPIQKRNGATGSASFWVMEKRGGLIWVLEEIVENVAFLTLDEDGKVLEARGDIEPIWAQERIKKGSHVTELFDSLPAQLMADDQKPSGWFGPGRGRFTAHTAHGTNVPTTVDSVTGPRDLRVCSFPHIAGMMVVSPATLEITSANSVFSAALFGYERPEGLLVSDLIPGFDGILRVLSEEDKVQLVDGLVIPEASFRRAWALLGGRDGKETVASMFLRPSGLPARHRDGTEIAVDVQMRVVKSESIFPDASQSTVLETDESDQDEVVALTEVVYALWFTYSRHLRSGAIGQDSTPESRPITPPSQPSPGAATILSSPGLHSSSASTKSADSSQLSLAGPLSQESIYSTISEEPLEHPGPHVVKASPEAYKKKTIDDFVILEEMGSGAYGKVNLVRFKKANSRRMVLKFVTKRRILVDTWTRDRRLGTVPLEIHVMDFLRRDELKHPNIVEMVDFFEDDVNYYIEMLPHGIPGMDLFDYIELRTSMDETECRSIFRQVVDAIHHLHIKALVVHRDIKDENIVLDGEGKIKLIDFGSAAYIKNGPFDVFVGTIDYAAPEVLQGKAYRGKEQDVWALGILLYTIVYKENPFYNIEEILDHPLRVPFIPFSDICIDLIRRMLDRDVDERITITEVTEHAWMVAE